MSDIEQKDAQGNYVKISPGIYLVRTQAGFRNALKNEFAADFGDWKWMIANRLNGFPRSYPSIVSLSVGYNGDTWFQCNCARVDQIKSVLIQEGLRGTR